MRISRPAAPFTRPCGRAAPSDPKTGRPPARDSGGRLFFVRQSLSRQVAHVDVADGDDLAGRVRAFVQALLHPDDVAPLAVFPARVREHAGLGKAHGRVQAGAGGVGQCDAAVRHAHALPAQHFQQSLHQGAANAPAVEGGRQVDGHFHVPAVGGALLVQVGVGITGDLPVHLADDVGIDGGDVADARGKFFQRGRAVLKAGRAARVGRVDGEQGLRVGLRRHAE